MKGEVAGIFVRNPFVNDFLFKYGYIKMPTQLQGWTYGLDGALLKATRITGIQYFNKHVCSDIFFQCNRIPIIEPLLSKWGDNLVDLSDHEG